MGDNRGEPPQKKVKGTLLQFLKPRGAEADPEIGSAHPRPNPAPANLFVANSASPAAAVADLLRVAAEADSPAPAKKLPGGLSAKLWTDAPIYLPCYIAL